MEIKSNGRLLFTFEVQHKKQQQGIIEMLYKVGQK